jgi:serine/threonine-protein kinase RsbW
MRLFSETLPAVPRSVPVLRAAISSFAREAGASGRTIEDIRLAVSEAISNAILHAYVDDDQPGAIWLTGELHDDILHITVSDAGRGMIPRIDSPGLGLGLPLIAQSAETFDVHDAGSGGTELRMSFRLGD